MFEHWNNHIIKFENIIKIYKKQINDQEILRYIDIMEGEFILYHSFNCRFNFFKFLLRFIFSFFYQTKYTLIFSDDKNSNFTFINTANYIYNDNLYPLVNKLNILNFKTSTLNLKKTSKFSFNSLSYYKNNFPLLRILKNKSIFLSKTNFILTLYTNFFTIPRLKYIQQIIENSSNKISNVILSADSCDIFSRLLAAHARANNKFFILLQNGPIQDDSIEWKTSISDEIIIWEESENYFKKYNKNFKIHFPPRFYYTLESHVELKKKYELVIFLPWILNNKNGNSLLIFINKILKHLINNSDYKIFIRYHPAGKIKLKNFNFDEISTNISTKEVLLNTKYVINFGSTISYDCNYLNIPCAVVNILNQLPDESPIFHLNSIYNIKTYNDLNNFINNPYFFRKLKIDKSYSLISHLISKLKNINEQY